MSTKRKVWKVLQISKETGFKFPLKQDYNEQVPFNYTSRGLWTSLPGTTILSETFSLPTFSTFVMCGHFITRWGMFMGLAKLGYFFYFLFLNKEIEEWSAPYSIQPLNVRLGSTSDKPETWVVHNYGLDAAGSVRESRWGRWWNLPSLRVDKRSKYSR